MNFLKIAVVFVFLLSIVSCKNEAKKEPEVKTIEKTEQKEPHMAEAISVELNDEKLSAVFKEYIALKTAFVNTDAKAAATEASNLMTAFANVGVDEFVLKAAQNIVESDDVEVQRSNFVIVTEAVEKMMEGAIDEGIIYKQYCPMAFDNTGAYWLSESKEIRNPYFGDKMLKCGRIESELQ